MQWDDPCPWDGGTLGEVLLTPTRLYVKPALAAARAGMVHALAHITGGGLTENLPRVLPEGLGAQIDLGAWELPPVFPLAERTWRHGRGRDAQDLQCRCRHDGRGPCGQGGCGGGIADATRARRSTASARWSMRRASPMRATSFEKAGRDLHLRRRLQHAGAAGGYGARRPCGANLASCCPTARTRAGLRARRRAACRRVVVDHRPHGRGPRGLRGRRSRRRWPPMRPT